MDKLNLTFKEGDVLHASSLTSIVQTLNSVIDNINTAIESISSGSAAATYDYTFEFHEGYSLGYNLVIRKYQDGKTYREKVVPYYESVTTMENALKEKGLCTSFNLTVKVLERTTDGELSFTTEGNPKFIRCGTDIQNNGWKLSEGTKAGQGKGSFEYIQSHYYYSAGRKPWNEGLDIGDDNVVYNPPTEFEVYSNPKIYKITPWSSSMDGIEFNVAENVEGLSLIKAIRNTLTTTVDNVPSTYTHDTYVHVAKDNILMEGFTVFRSSELDWSKFIDLTTVGNETSPNIIFGNNFNFDRWCRAYLSDPEYYPDPSNGSYRGYVKYFKRNPKTGQGGYDFLLDGNITLNKGDIFVYFKKKENIVGTRINPTTKIYIDDIWINPRDYGWEGDTWLFNACIDFIMYAAHNDLIGSDGNTYRDVDTIPEGITTIPAWISYYDLAHHLPDGTIIGVLDDVNNIYTPSKPNVHYHGKWVRQYNSLVGTVPTHIYTIPWEEYVYKSNGERCNRFGGDNYEIMAFCANQKIEFKNIQF